jgi:type I restriction enzyme S subunit
MTGKYKAYPEYKNLENGWPGAVPKDWSLLPLKYLSKFIGGGTPSKDKPEYWNGSIPWVSPKDMKTSKITSTIDNITQKALEQSSTSLIKEGALLLVVRSGILQHSIPVAINDVPVTLNQDMKAIHFNERLNTKYAMYVIAGSQPALLLEWRKQGATVESIEQEYLANTIFPIPSIKEQDRIIKFLDHETAKIDNLIEKQQRFINLLKEKRHAVISHAVTKGFNSNVEMRDSGVDWLGEVPSGWEISRLKYHTTLFEQGWSPQCDSRQAEDNEFGVLKVGCVNYGVFNSNENKALPKELTPQLQYLIQKGDLLVSRANTKELVGSAAVVDKSHDNIILCDKLYRLKFDELIDPQWVAYYLALPIVRQQIELGASGASHSMQNIGQSTIKELPIVIPSPEEMTIILSKIKNKIDIFELTLSHANEQIALLQERRTALISAAVTGKIDVRDWVAPQTSQTNKEVAA